MQPPADSSSSASSTSSDEPQTKLGAAVAQSRASGARRCDAKAFVHGAKIALRIGGAAVSLVFSIQGFWIFFHPDFADQLTASQFSAFCRWLSQALLGVLGGLAGCYLEVKALTHAGHFAKFALNRIATSVFYLWIGFWLIGFADASGHQLPAPLLIAVGLVAWLVSLGDLMVSCTSHLGASKDGAQGSEGVQGTCSGEEGQEAGVAHNDGNDIERDGADFRAGVAPTGSTYAVDVGPPSVQTVTWNQDAFSRPFGAA